MTISPMSESTTPSIGATPSTHTTSSNTSSSLPTPSSQSSKESTACYLEGVCTGGVLAINDRDYDYSNGELYKTVSSSFRAHFENFPHPLTLAERSAILQQTIEHFRTTMSRSRVSLRRSTNKVELPLCTWRPKSLEHRRELERF